MSIYGQRVSLLAAMEVECWNFSNGAVGKLYTGDVITILHVSDATHTVVQVAGPGRAVYLNNERMLYDGEANEYTTKKGNEVKGYRFIVPNKLLAECTGLEVPEKTEDIVGDIIALENGEGTPEQAERLAEALEGTSIGEKIRRRYL